MASETPGADEKRLRPRAEAEAEALESPPPYEDVAPNYTPIEDESVLEVDAAETLTSDSKGSLPSPTSTTDASIAGAAAGTAASSSSGTGDAGPDAAIEDPTDRYHDTVLFLHTTWCARGETAIDDITARMTAPYNNKMSDAFAEEAHRIGQDFKRDKTHAPSVSLIKENFWGTRHRIVDNRSGEQVAVMKTPAFSTGRSELLFRETAADGGKKKRGLRDDVLMKPRNLVSRQEQFTMGGAEFQWRAESFLTHTKLALYKRGGGRWGEVARFAQPRFFQSSGVVVLDSKEVDEIVVAATCWIMLKKKKQRRRERHGGGAGP